MKTRAGKFYGDPIRDAQIRGSLAALEWCLGLRPDPSCLAEEGRLAEAVADREKRL